MWRFFPLIFLLVFSPLIAQDGPVISPDNAAQLTETGYVGGTLPGELVWSPDSTTLAINTSEGTKLYTPSDGNLRDTDGNEVAAWSNPPTPEPVIEHFDSAVDDAGNLTVTVTDPALPSPVILPTNLPGQVIEGLIASNSPTAAIAISDPSSTIVVQLWDLSDASLIATFQQPFEFLHTLAFQGYERLLVVATYTDAIYGDTFEKTNVYGVGSREARETATWTSLPDRYGDYLAYMADGQIVLWHQQDKQTLKCGVTAFNPTFTPDGRYLIAGDFYSSDIVVWEVEALNLCRPLQIWIPSTRFGDFISPEGTRLAGYNATKQFAIFDIQSGSQLQSFDAEENASLHFSDDWRFLVTTRTQKTIWNVETGEKIVEAPTEAVVSADWSTIAWWVDGSVKVVDLNTSEETVIPVIDVVMGSLVAFSPAREWAVFSKDELQVIDMRASEQVANFPKREDVFFSDDGTRLVFGWDNNAPFQMWDTSDLQAPLVEKGPPANLISPDKRFVSGLFISGMGGESPGGGLFLADLETAFNTHWMLYDYNDNAQAFSPDSQMLAFGFGDGSVVLIDVAHLPTDTGGNNLPVKTEFPLPRPTDVVRLMFSQDTHYLAAQVKPGEPFPSQEPEGEVTGVYLWQGEEERLFVSDASLVGFSPDNRLLVTRQNNTLSLWTIDSGEEIAAVEGSTGAFSPDGSLLATHSGAQLLVYAVESPDVPLVALENDDRVSQIAFNADGTRLYVVSAAGVRIYGVSK